MKHRNVWFGISGAIILAGVIALGVNGLNLGIDFKGGTQITFQTPPGVLDRARSRRSWRSRGSPTRVVQGKGKLVNGERHAVADPYEDAQARGAGEGPAGSEDPPRRLRRRRAERLRDVRPPDRDRRDLRDHRLAPPDHDLHHDQVRPEVRDPGHPRDDPRHRSSRSACTRSSGRRSRSRPLPLS